MRPVRRIRNLVSSIRCRRHVTTCGTDKLPLDIERMLASDDDDEYDFDIVMTDFVGIAKKAALVPPTKSCLKKTGAPSRNVKVTFEGQKKAWVPKSLLRKRAEAKQHALEVATKEAEIPSTPAMLTQGKKEALCSVSTDSSVDDAVSSPLSITSGQSPPKPVPTKTRVQILVRASSIDSAESISPKIGACPGDETHSSLLGGNAQQQQLGMHTRLSIEEKIPVLVMYDSFQSERDALVNVLKSMGAIELVSRMPCSGHKSNAWQTHEKTHLEQNTVDFFQYIASDDDEKCSVDNIVDYESAAQLCDEPEDTAAENLKEYTSNIL